MCPFFLPSLTEFKIIKYKKLGFSLLIVPRVYELEFEGYEKLLSLFEALKQVETSS